MKKKLSIIIPHYNSFPLLSRLIASIPEKEYIEVIVVDDYSDDFDKNIIKFKDFNHISFVKNTQSKGAGTCRNIGIDHSSGEYVLFADSDDFFVKGAFDTIHRYLSGKENEKVDVVFFKPDSCFSNNIKKPSNRHLKYVYLIDNYLNDSRMENEIKLKYTHNVPWSKLIRRELISINIRFDETIVANDGMFSLRVGKAMEDFLVCEETIYMVTYQENSLTTTKNYNNYKVRLMVFCDYYKSLTEDERKILGISPLPILYTGRIYGFKAMLESVLFFKAQSISIFKNFRISAEKLKQLFG
ncbi:glycosyltransferase family 2 protein [Vibrio chagasii]|uniref:glycosyltransferase family 2 protein n=1 Tax=Vibrio chagasii TaxID=170679 RepID=UPI001EFDA432|nr:glycosyltransferase family 2 protein [Vibrio chagasii]MCG9565857.1 glycosyltransferase family 2 protein [Vibrio chagasii]